MVDSSYLPPAHPSQALQYFADLGFQNVLPPFRTVSNYCLPVSDSNYIYILLKNLPPSFTVCPLLLFTFIVAVAICCVIPWFYVV